MRNLSETGADKVHAYDEEDEWLTLANFPGRVLVIQEKPSYRTFERFGTTPHVLLVAVDEATGEKRTYISAAARLVRQAATLENEWNGQPVRCRVATKRNQYGNVSAWLEDAPPAATRKATPSIYTEAELAARAHVTELGNELRTSDQEKRDLVRVHSDEMGRINWPAIEAVLADLATKQRLEAQQAEQQATAKSSKKPAPVH